MAKVSVTYLTQIVTGLLAEVGSANAHRNILHQLVLLVPEARGLHRANLQIVLHHVSRQRVHHIHMARSHDEQLLTLLDDWLQHLLYLQNVPNLNVSHQNHHVLEHTLVLLLVVDEQRTQIPPVNLQTHCRLGISVCGLASLNRDDAITSHVLVHLGNDSPYLPVVVR